ncbi:DUF1684 domain-containing protein [Micromonospora sp. NPDC049679]|uniref:DUF1684 domain-containing protein n=1 Tax=Micromonospora sp. NPDC049679 TaxID=3155920 RepID=UPI00340C267A
MTDIEFADEWRRWHADREAAVAAPGGNLTLTGTHWVSDETEIGGVPGRWRAEGDAVRVSGAVGLTVEGEPVSDGLFGEGQRLAVGDLQLAIIRRGDDLAVRTFDPRSEGVQRFAGIDAYDPDPAWVVTAEFHPTTQPDHTLHIVHTNSGREVDYAVVGTFTFTVAGQRAELVGLNTGHEGEAHITFRDATSGRETYGASRFLFLPLPTAAGPVVIDFNRAILPPCAFSDAFICPLPPAENILPFAITAGEKQLLTRP